MQIAPSAILTIPYDIYKKHWSNSVVTERLCKLLDTNLWTADAINDVDGVDPDHNILSVHIPWDDTHSRYDDVIKMITTLQDESIPFTVYYQDADEVVGIYAYGYFLEDGSYISDNWDTSYSDTPYCLCWV